MRKVLVTTLWCGILTTMQLLIGCDRTQSECGEYNIQYKICSDDYCQDMAKFRSVEACRVVASYMGEGSVCVGPGGPSGAR